MTETGEWFYRGKFYGTYPAVEVDKDHKMYERHLERKADEQREEKRR